MTSPVPARTRVVSLLDIDDELAAVVPAEDVEVARRMAAGEVLALPPGPTTALEERTATRGVLGFYVLSGVIVRCVSIGHAVVPELIGPGEAIVPPAQLDSVVPLGESFSVVEPAELVVLEESVARALGRWPALATVIQRRSAQQRLRATGLAAIGHLPSAEVRILAVLWHLAETWGKVVVGGTLIPFPFTHATLGQLMGARRPTVSLALVNLDNDGLVKRQDDGSWLLPTGSDEALHKMLANGTPASEPVMRARVSRQAARDLVQRAERSKSSAKQHHDDAFAVRAQSDQVARRRDGA